MNKRTDRDAPQHNRLAAETSPYLQQHSLNPVDWYPWGEEALQKAREEDKPIFLSIGYAACHWCHVMAHECFEDQDVAALLNAHYVPIKVDREERPDIDEIYMQAVILLSGHGGWPLSVWLSPDLQPFAGGTYFPREDHQGRPGFKTILRAIAQHYREDRDHVDDVARQITEHLRGIGRYEVGGLPPDVLSNAATALLDIYDDAHGGFGQAPKFPPAQSIETLLRHHKQSGDERSLEAATVTLRHMAEGGIYDQIGGGFHRYSTDRAWHVPHFEKMLYDNALLARAYCDAWRVTRDPMFGRVGREVLTYVMREMLSPDGGFYASTDADSEGEEGRFFTWTPEEVEAVVGAELGALVCQWYDITPDGNYREEATGRSTGRSIPRLRYNMAQFAAQHGKDQADLAAQIAEARTRLYAARESREHPLRDEKIITAWNGLMISAFATGAQAFDEHEYRQAAERAARFILSRLREDNRLRRSYRNGRARYNGYLDDYACVIEGLLDLYELTYEVFWLQEAKALTRTLNDHFWDADGGGYYYTSDDHEALILRRKDFHDGAIPSGNSVQCRNLIRLGLLTGDANARDRAEQIIRLASRPLTDYPQAVPSLVNAAAFQQDGGRELALVGRRQDEGMQEMIREVHHGFHPHTASAMLDTALPVDQRHSLEAAVPLLINRTPQEDRPTAYVCRNFTCKAPVSSVEALRGALIA